MQKEISLGTRKIVRVNRSFYVGLPKTMLQNIGLDAEDRLEFFIVADGTCMIRPVKGEGER